MTSDPQLQIEPGDTERETFNRSLYCGQLPTDTFDSTGCGARDWRVFRPNIWPPWTRELICQQCGEHTCITLPEEERRLAKAHGRV